MTNREFAWTGPMPKQGYVGYVNVKVEDDGVVFTVRAEGASTGQSYKVPRDVAALILRGAASVAES